MSSAFASLKRAIEPARAFVRRPAVKRALSIAQYALLAAIVAYLIHRLSRVGWGNVIDALPTALAFYAIFSVRYFVLPLSEIPTYELVWRRPLWRHVAAFLRKRAYNFAVMGYSGEAFFTLWARRALHLSDREILIGVKDNNIISAFVSNLATVLIVVYLFFSGDLEAEIRAFPGAGVLFGLAFVTAAALALAVLTLRRKLIDLPKGVMPRLVSINSARIAVVTLLSVFLYNAAIPSVPPQAWLAFLALQFVLSRVPFVPNQDLFYMTGALALSTAIGASEAAVAGMLVAEAALSQIFNVIAFLATSHLAVNNRKKVRDGRSPPGEDRP
jgi:hypothetical protein